MKKTLTTALALIMVLSLTACGGDTPASQAQSSTSSAAPSSSTASVANEASSKAESTPATASPYTLQVEISGAKEAIFAIGGVSAAEKNPNGEQRHWKVIAGQYCIQLKDNGDGVLKCQGGFQNTSGSWDYPYKQSYSMDGNTLYLQASLQETDIDFNKIEQFELQVKEPSGYTTASIPAADVIVDKIALPNTSTSSSESTPSTSVSDEVKPIGEFYNDADELLTITKSKISFKNDGNDYSVDYPSTAPEVVDNTMNKLAFTANGSQIELYYRPADFTLNQTKSIQITIDGKPSKYMSRAKGNISAIAGTYKGQSDDVLTISSDNSFSFTSPKTGTITGTIPAGHKSGDKITAGEYEITLHYGSNNSGMSVDIRSADAKTIIGTDMVRS